MTSQEARRYYDKDVIIFKYSDKGVKEGVKIFLDGDNIRLVGSHCSLCFDAVDGLSLMAALRDCVKQFMDKHEIRINQGSTSTIDSYKVDIDIPLTKDKELTQAIKEN